MISSFDFWAILLACMCNVACALLGCWLMLRRMSLIGDAIAHAVLPGIALAYFLSGQISGPPVILGAMALGLLTAFLTQALTSSGAAAEDSSMGIVFTSLFAVGVLMVTRGAGKAHIDIDCVLAGELLYAPDRRGEFLGMEVPAAFGGLAAMLLLTLAFTTLLWKELKLASFDPGLATAMGFNAAIIHYLLMALVGGVTVAAFEVVGSILVVAMLIVPAATAHLLTDRLTPLLLLSAVVAILSSIAGYLTAEPPLDTTPAGMMAVCAGGFLLLAVFLAPRHGILGKLWRTWRLRVRIAAEDVLARLYRREEAGDGALPVVEARQATPGFARRFALRSLLRNNHIKRIDKGILLTDDGRSRARSLIRAHRLWETYLDENLALPRDHLHDAAHRMEHFLDPALQEELAREVKRADVDPHGRSIPPPA